RSGAEPRAGAPSSGRSPPGRSTGEHRTAPRRSPRASGKPARRPATSRPERPLPAAYLGTMTAPATKIHHRESKFDQLLQEQIRNEFNSFQQYTALAVWFDDEDLPQLARHFYRQALEERNHAMMIVQYLLDNNIKPSIPGIDSVWTGFGATRELCSLALEQERDVTRHLENLARTAREEGDCLG